MIRVAPNIASADWPLWTLVWMVSRRASPTSRAAWNMVGVSSSEGLRSAGTLVRSSRMLTTDWVVARLPAVIRVIIRSPGLCQVNILRTVATLSTPALVRVSDMNTSPLLRRMPTQ